LLGPRAFQNTKHGKPQWRGTTFNPYLNKAALKISRTVQ
jgi:hypothetical protein